MKRRCDEVISIFFAVVFSLLYWKYAILAHKENFLTTASIGNIKCYIVMILLFFVCCFIIYFLVGKITYTFVVSMTESRLLFGLIMLILLCITYPLWDVALEKNYGIQIVAEPIFVLNVLLTMVICYMLDCESTKGNLVVNGLLVIGTFMWGIAGTTVNTYSAVRVYMAGNLHHTSAYLDSIYNVMRGMPFCGNLTEQYGHYGLFF